MMHQPLIAIILCAVIGVSCAAVDAAPQAPAAPVRERLPGPSQATCDPNMCPVYCLRAACGRPQEACLSTCQAVCGDGYFDDRDGPVMACTLAARAGIEDTCAVARKCCERDYTSQLCVR